MRVIDVSAPPDGNGPYWPGSRGYAALSIDSHVERGDPATNSTVMMDVHGGTHVDAPAHHLVGGRTIDELPLEAMLGPVTAVEVNEDADEIDLDLLRSTFGAGLPERVLFKTRSSNAWGCDKRSFDPLFVGLTFEPAKYLADGGLRLVGVDAPSVQRFGDSDDTHHVLFTAGVVVLDPRSALGGNYELVCLPIVLVGAEAAPARVVLIASEEN